MWALLEQAQTLSISILGSELWAFISRMWKPGSWYITHSQGLALTPEKKNKTWSLSTFKSSGKQITTVTSIADSTGLNSNHNTVRNAPNPETPGTLNPRCWLYPKLLLAAVSCCSPSGAKWRNDFSNIFPCGKANQQALLYCNTKMKPSQCAGVHSGTD